MPFSQRTLNPFVSKMFAFDANKFALFNSLILKI